MSNAVITKAIEVARTKALDEGKLHLAWPPYFNGRTGARASKDDPDAIPNDATWNWILGKPTKPKAGTRQHEQAMAIATGQTAKHISSDIKHYQSRDAFVKQYDPGFRPSGSASAAPQLGGFAPSSYIASADLAPIRGLPQRFGDTISAYVSRKRTGFGDFLRMLGLPIKTQPASVWKRFGNLQAASQEFAMLNRQAQMADALSKRYREQAQASAQEHDRVENERWADAYAKAGKEFARERERMGRLRKKFAETLPVTDHAVANLIQGGFFDEQVLEDVAEKADAAVEEKKKKEEFHIEVKV